VDLLIAALDDPNWIVRFESMTALAHRGSTAEKAVPRLKTIASPCPEMYFSRKNRGIRTSGGLKI